MPGRRRHRRDEEHGVVHGDLGGARHGRLAGPAEYVIHAHHVGEEQRVEEAALEQLRELDPGLEIRVRLHLVAWLRPEPGRLMDDTVHVKRVADDALGHAGLLAGHRATWRSSPQSSTRFAPCERWTKGITVSPNLGNSSS